MIFSLTTQVLMFFIHMTIVTTHDNSDIVIHIKFMIFVFTWKLWHLYSHENCDIFYSCEHFYIFILIFSFTVIYIIIYTKFVTFSITGNCDIFIRMKIVIFLFTRKVHFHSQNKMWYHSQEHCNSFIHSRENDDIFFSHENCDIFVNIIK